MGAPRRRGHSVGSLDYQIGCNLKVTGSCDWTTAQKNLEEVTLRILSLGASHLCPACSIIFLSCLPRTHFLVRPAPKSFTHASSPPPHIFWWLHLGHSHHCPLPLNLKCPFYSCPCHHNLIFPLPWAPRRHEGYHFWDVCLVPRAVLALTRHRFI